MGWFRAYPMSVSLALKDLRHDWQSAGCFVAALVGMLAPLLIVFALKNGVISTMIDRLVDDPANREIIAVGAGQHTSEFFDQLTADPQVDFIVPATRSINTMANAVRHMAQRKLLRKVELIPTAKGDPLVPGADIAPGYAAISQALADELDARSGDTLRLRIDRRLNDEPQTAERDLTVVTVLPDETYGRPALFISLPDLLAVERFRDDRTVVPETWTNATAFPASYASFRLYASSLQSVGPLERRLRQAGVENRPRAANVSVLLSLQRGLNLLFVLISGLALMGFWAAMAANLRGAVERQRVSVSLLSLLGLGDAGRRAIPLIQSLVLVLSGVVLTLVLTFPVIALINAGFTPQGFERVAWLGLKHIVWTVVFGVLVAVTASVWAVISIGRIGSDEVLRAT